MEKRLNRTGKLAKSLRRQLLMYLKQTTKAADERARPFDTLTFQLALLNTAQISLSYTADTRKKC